MTRKLARRALRAMKRSIDHQQRAIVQRTEAVMREEAQQAAAPKPTRSTDPRLPPGARIARTPEEFYEDLTITGNAYVERPPKEKP